MKKLLWFIVLFSTELILFFGTIFILRNASVWFDLDYKGQNVLRDVSKGIDILANVIWALIVFEGKRNTKIITGIFSGVLLLLELYAILQWGGDNVNNNPILTILLIFAGQFIYWTIIAQFKILIFKKKPAALNDIN